MKKIKKFILTAFIFLLIGICAGCSNVDFTIIEFEDGSYKEAYTVNFSDTEFINIGASTDQVNELKMRLENRLKLMAGVGDFPGSIERDYFDRIDSSENSATKAQELKDGFNCELYIEDGTYQLIFTYSNLEIYRTYHGITQEDLDQSKDDIVIEKQFLTYKIIQPSVTRFESKVQRLDGTYTTLDNYMWEESLAEMKDVLGETIASKVVKPTFTYTYGTASHRLHSDADYVYSSAGYYFHIWEIGENEEDRQITFYTTEARREVWYPLILGASLIFALVLYLVVYFKKRKENKKLVEETEQKEVSVIEEQVEEQQEIKVEENEQKVEEAEQKVESVAKEEKGQKTKSATVKKQSTAKSKTTTKSGTKTAGKTSKATNSKTGKSTKTSTAKYKTKTAKSGKTTTKNSTNKSGTKTTKKTTTKSGEQTE